MLHDEALALLLGAIALGAVHGIEPGHGWPVAAAYAIDRGNAWFHGLASSLIIGVGHLVSSLAMVGLFFAAKEYLQLTRVNEPVAVAGGVEIGGPVSIVAGVVLVLLGVREYRHDRSHQHGGHHHAEEEPAEPGIPGRLWACLPFADRNGAGRRGRDGVDQRGLVGMAWTGFALGFAHEEEFEIIAICAGSPYCLELMVAYATTVLVGIVGLTMLMVAGYEYAEERVARIAPYLPAFSAAVLVVMGLGFVAGLL